MDYLLLKTIHITCVAVTFVLFSGRGVLMLVDSPLLKARFLRIAPHVNDTLLLGSALWMAVISGHYPFAESWLTAKLVALIVYICLGRLPGHSEVTRWPRFRLWPRLRSADFVI